MLAPGIYAAERLGFMRGAGMLSGARMRRFEHHDPLLVHEL
jgi:hypothetical protein